MDIKNKVTNPTLFKIAQLLVNEKYFSGDKRFFIYIHNFSNKLQGDFSKDEFESACKKYLSANKREAKEFQQMNDCTYEEALEGKVQEYFEEYWGNG
jgi:hypothetical protein